MKQPGEKLQHQPRFRPKPEAPRSTTKRQRERLQHQPGLRHRPAKLVVRQQPKRKRQPPGAATTAAEKDRRRHRLDDNEQRDKQPNGDAREQLRSRPSDPSLPSRTAATKRGRRVLANVKRRTEQKVTRSQPDRERHELDGSSFHHNS